MNSNVEKVSNKGWKNVFIKELKVVSSWGRAVTEDHDPSTLPDQLKTFSLHEGKNQRPSSKRTHDLKVFPNLEGVSNKVPARMDNAQQVIKDCTTGPVGGSKPIHGGATNGSPPRKTIPLFKDMKVFQSKASSDKTIFLQIRSGSEFISPQKQRVSGDSTHGIGSSLYGADKKPSILICSHNNPLESKGPILNIGKTKRRGDQSSKLEGFVSSSSWNMDTGPPYTDSWNNLVEECNSHPLSDGKWVPLLDRKSPKVASLVDALEQMKIIGNSLFMSVGSQHNGEAQNKYPNDDGWETVPKRKKGFSGNKSPPTLQTRKVHSNRAILQDSSGTTRSGSRMENRVVDDFELMGKRLGRGNKLLDSHEEFDNSK